MPLHLIDNLRLLVMYLHLFYMTNVKDPRSQPIT